LNWKKSFTLIEVWLAVTRSIEENSK